MLTNAELDARLAAMESEWRDLIAALIPDIADEYRATDDPEDDMPGMCVTVACDDDVTEWSYQTGDNSFTGGAYGLPHWAVVSIYRGSDPTEVARKVSDQLGEAIAGADLIRED